MSTSEPRLVKNSRPETVNFDCLSLDELENPNKPGSFGSQISQDLIIRSEEAGIENESIWQYKFYQWAVNWKFINFVYIGIVSLLIPTLVWLIGFLITGNQNLPGGSIFILFVLEFGGRFLGYGVEFLKLPPMIGMLGLGILIRNTPNFDFGKYLDPRVSAPIRQLALMVILTRAGLGLDVETLLKRKGLVFRLAFIPTILEALIVGISAHLILNFPWSWALLLGFVLAAVSPAVVVPRLLHLRENGFGVEKGIPTVLIAAASLDNIVAISLFGVTLGFALSDGRSIGFSIVKGPLEIIIGLTVGVIWGILIGIIFNSSQMENKNALIMRTLLTFTGGASCLIGFQQLGFSGAGALGCLVSSFTAALVWRARGVFVPPDPLTWIFYLLWYFFEPLLFGAIGCQIDFSKMDSKVLLLGSICILIGAIGRFVIAFVMSTAAEFEVKEKLFVAISWIPKATVQAAIGPVALDTALNMGGSSENVHLGLQVLTLAVIVIIITAPLGELLVIFTGPKFLKKKRTVEDLQNVSNVL